MALSSLYNSMVGEFALHPIHLLMAAAVVVLVANLMRPKVSRASEDDAPRGASSHGAYYDL